MPPDVGQPQATFLPAWMNAARSSLRFRVFAMTLIVVLLAVGGMAAFTLRRFEQASILQLQHEAILLSDLLESSIGPLMLDGGDVEAIQSLVDRVVDSREINDIEINIQRLEGFRSSFIASNIPDNIEGCSVYEHRNMLSTLEGGEPVIFIGKDDLALDEALPGPGHPDYYLGHGKRFISLTTPIIVQGEKLGSVNSKLSLSKLDEELSAIKLTILGVAVALPLLAALAIFWVTKRGLRPINKLAEEVSAVDPTDLASRFSARGAPSELQTVIGRLNQLMDRLDGAFRRERMFTANAAHELRTPIATLKVMAEVGLQEANGNGTDGMEFCRDAYDIASQMETLVANLLGLVRSESGSQEIKIEPVDLKKIVMTGAAAFEKPAAEKGLRLQCDIANEAKVESDGTLITAIVTNLLSNATSYAPFDGAIRVELSAQEDRFRLVVANAAGELSQDDMDHLFEPFWRKEAARSDSAHCGIGLSLVQAFARLLDIEITARINDDGEFEIELMIPSLTRRDLKATSGSIQELSNSVL